MVREGSYGGGWMLETGKGEGRVLVGGRKGKQGWGGLAVAKVSEGLRERLRYEFEILGL